MNRNEKWAAAIVSPAMAFLWLAPLVAWMMTESVVAGAATWYAIVVGGVICALLNEFVPGLDAL